MGYKGKLSVWNMKLTIWVDVKKGDHYLTQIILFFPIIHLFFKETFIENLLCARLDDTCWWYKDVLDVVILR